MRRIIVLAAFLYLSILMRAQPYIPAVRFVSADPSGSCSNSPPLRYNYTNGKLWGCENGTWTQINGGGSGSGTVTSVSAGNLSPIFTTSVATPTVTPALSFTLSSFAQNGFLAGSSTGGAGAPTVRAITCNDQPALTGDTTTSAGSCATTTAKINGTAFPTSAAVVGSNGSAQPIAATTTGTGSTAVLSASPALTGVPTTPTATAGDNTTQIATDAFVTTAVNNAIAGVNPAVAVNAATTAAGDTSGLTYNNGVSGVGATFTGTTNTAITIDGVTFTTVGQRLLVKNDTQSPSGAFNGIYSFTQLQTGLLPPIFTRALDYDQPSDMNNTGAIPAIGGTLNAGKSWILTSTVVTVGTTPLTFAVFTLNAITQARRTCVIDNDTQAGVALIAAQFSGHCVIPAAATIVEVDVLGGTGSPTGSPAAPTMTGTSSIQIGKLGTSSSTGLLSGVLATVAGVACALTSTSGSCALNGGITSSSSVTISTTSLASGDMLYVASASADGIQTWYTVTIIYTIN